MKNTMPARRMVTTSTMTTMMAVLDPDLAPPSLWLLEVVSSTEAPGLES